MISIYNFKDTVVTSVAFAYLLQKIAYLFRLSDTTTKFDYRFNAEGLNPNCCWKTRVK